MLLEVSNLTVSYDRAVILNDLSMHVDHGELVSLVGPNAAGKTTLLRAITGLVAREREITRRSAGEKVVIKGNIRFSGIDIENMPPHEIVKMGLIHAPERRRPFREMTVLENLHAGGFLLDNKKDLEENLDNVYQLFPVLKKRSDQISGTLSGGEQQMLAVGRALMFKPKLLCIDEPSTGLSPMLRSEVFSKINQISKQGITMLLIEQEVHAVFKMATRNYILSSGRIIAEGQGDVLLKDELVRKTYLGL
ncbi:MAG: branched-chain amino acid ABC transporter ATP-binding protein [Chloroflexi bacterium RBG_16_48_7]|nr:MAG: branched-chain amino acid ABC transporter ATP-binding protein [Chloroflexi bacterium RBG_16_48_7]